MKKFGVIEKCKNANYSLAYPPGYWQHSGNARVTYEKNVVQFDSTKQRRFSPGKFSSVPCLYCNVKGLLYCNPTKFLNYMRICGFHLHSYQVAPRQEDSDNEDDVDEDENEEDEDDGEQRKRAKQKTEEERRKEEYGAEDDIE